MDDGFLIMLILAAVIFISGIVTAYACRGGTFESAVARDNADRSALHSPAESKNTALTNHKAKSKVAKDVQPSTDITRLTDGDSSKRSKPSVTFVDDGNGSKSTGPQSRRRPARKQSEHPTISSDSTRNYANASHSATKQRKTGA
jgi:hypothetical protein